MNSADIPAGMMKERRPGPRHEALWREIDAMQVADCLVWDIPDDLKPHAFHAAVSRYVKLYHPGRIARTNIHQRRAFITRIA